MILVCALTCMCWGVHVYVCVVKLWSITPHSDHMAWSPWDWTAAEGGFGCVCERVLTQRVVGSDTSIWNPPVCVRGSVWICSIPCRFCQYKSESSFFLVDLISDIHFCLKVLCCFFFILHIEKVKSQINTIIINKNECRCWFSSVNFGLIMVWIAELPHHVLATYIFLLQIYFPTKMG